MKNNPNCNKCSKCSKSISGSCHRQTNTKNTNHECPLYLGDINGIPVYGKADMMRVQNKQNKNI